MADVLASVQNLPGRLCLRKPLVIVRSLTLSFTFSLIAVTTHGQGLGVYAPPLGYGNAWGMAHANTGVTLDSGLVAGDRNPAAYLTGRNEIYGEGGAWGAFSISHLVGGPDMQFGAGTINYLTALGPGSFVIGYIPMSRLQRGAEYPTGEVIDRVAYHRVEAAYALGVSELWALGISASMVGGTRYTGVIREPADLDTTYSPTLYEFTAGLRKRRGDFRMGIVITAPAFGEIEVRRPINIGNRRDRISHDFRGGWTVRIGLGLMRRLTGIEFDIELCDADAARLDGQFIPDGSRLVSAGVAMTARVSPVLSVGAGFRARWSDPEVNEYLLQGLGISYAVTPDVTMYGSGELYFPVGDRVAGTTLEDIRPYAVRAGVMYHGE